MSIDFNSNIYTKNSILESMKVFRHLADFSIEYKKNIFKVNISNINKDVKDNFCDEFGNYVLSLMYKMSKA